MTNSPEAAAAITLDELISVERLQLTMIVGHTWAGETTVSWAHATEMIDPRPHLRGSELVCTVGATLLTPANCAQFVSAVHATGSAAICLGIGEVHTQVPRALVLECQRLSIPLVSMAHGVAFVEINDVLADARVNAQAGSSARNTDLIARLLIELRANTPVEEIMSVASQAIGGDLVLERVSSTCEKFDGDDDPPASSGETFLPSDHRTRLSVVSTSGNRLTWIGTRPDPDPDLLAQIARIAEVAIHEKDERDRHGRQRIGHLFALVANGLADAAAVMPELQNLRLAGRALTISAWPAETASVLAQRLPEALIADAPETTFVVMESAESVGDIAHELGLVCGYSSPIEANQVSRGIAEALAALVLARQNGSVAGPESLTSLSGLLEQQPHGRLMPFIDQLITPIVTIDGRRGGQLLETLRTFVERQGSIQETADVRFLHVNTVRHRLAKIRQLVGRNPLDHGDRVALEIALWAFDRGQRRNS